MSALENNNQPSQKRTLRKQTVSQRKIEANRRNSLRSTGPKTARGKQTVARNAIKHGLLAREVVITSGGTEEAVEEFDALAEPVYLNTISPSGTAESVAGSNDSELFGGERRASSGPRTERYAVRLDAVAVDRHLTKF